MKPVKWQVLLTALVLSDTEIQRFYVPRLLLPVRVPALTFYPLSVDFEERLYSVGHIPGSYNRREGRPTDKAILASRVIDRPIRPLFPKDLRNDVNINLTVMSVDPDCSHEIAGMIGASIALSISDIPWNGPIAGVYVGLVDGEIIINPTEEQRLRSDLELTVAGSHKR